MITGDKRNLEIASFVVYRVADPIRFLRGSGSLDQAEARLNERVSAALSDAIGRRDLAALATTDRAKWALDDLTREAAAAVAPAARGELGIEVLDLGLRRFNHPLEVRPAVFDLIRSERRQVAARLRAEGEAQYTAITSQADRTRDAILAQADAEAERIRGQAQAESTRILNEAHGRDPKFYELLRTLESYASILDARTTIVLSASSPLLKLLDATARARTRAPRARCRPRRRRPRFRPSSGGPTHEVAGGSRGCRGRSGRPRGVHGLGGGPAGRAGRRAAVRTSGLSPRGDRDSTGACPWVSTGSTVVRTDEVRRLSVGPGDPLEAGGEAYGGEFLAGDLNLVRIRAVVQYRVDDPVAYVVQGEAVEGLLQRFAEAGLSACLARRGIDAVLRAGRQAIAGEVEGSLRQAVREHRIGLSILGVSLTDARPPAEVAEDFVAAQSAENQRDRRGNEARTRAETTLTSSRAESQARLERARSAAHRKLVASRAQAERFLLLVDEVRRSRPLTIQRIYLDAMKSMLDRVRRKVVLPPGDSVDLTVLGVEE